MIQFCINPKIEKKKLKREINKMSLINSGSGFVGGGLVGKYL